MKWVFLFFLVISFISSQCLASETTLKQDLDALKVKKLEIFDKSQQLHKELSELEASLIAIKEEQSNKEIEIHVLQKDIQSTLSLLLRLSRTNPLRLLVEPSKSTYLTHGRVLISSLSKQLIQKIHENQKKLIELNTLTQSIHEKSQIHLHLLSQLKNQRMDLEKLTTEKIDAWQALEQQRLQDVDINNLLSDEMVHQDTLPSLSTDFPLGHLTAPALGKVNNFKIYKNFSPHSKGVTIEATKKAKISSPCDGKIVFIGSFHQHKNTIIINHGYKINSILIGADIINASLGQTVYSGETIGYMAGYGSDKILLYFELRREGKAIDPRPYFKTKK